MNEKMSKRRIQIKDLQKQEIEIKQELCFPVTTVEHPRYEMA